VFDDLVQFSEAEGADRGPLALRAADEASDEFEPQGPRWSAGRFLVVKHQTTPRVSPPAGSAHSPRPKRERPKRERPKRVRPEPRRPVRPTSARRRPAQPTLERAA